VPPDLSLRDAIRGAARPPNHDLMIRASAERRPIALSLGQVGGTWARPGRSAEPIRVTRNWCGSILPRWDASDAADSGDAFAVKLPSWRLDLERRLTGGRGRARL